MEDLVARVFSIGFLAVGLSHCIQGRLWEEFFREVLGSRLGPFIIALYTLPIALFVALGHNVWVLDIPVLITIMGWLMVAKSVLYLIYPSVTKAIAKERFRTHRKFVLGGAVMTMVGALLVYDSFLRAAS